MAKSTPSLTRADAFVQAVESALEHNDDPAWLGDNSPLAAPYFIAARQTAVATAAAMADSNHRGGMLQEALRGAASHLPEEHQRLLNAAYFQRSPFFANIDVAENLGYAQSSYYRHRASAIDQLARALVKVVAPALRPEQPRGVTTFVGRVDLLNTALDGLRRAQSVALIGSTGMGKTALGAALTKAWGRDRVFWFTFRPGLNDHLSSLIFTLAYFLQSAGATRAWRQLVADHGHVHIDRMLGLVRFDLAELRSTPVLLCLDEFHLLDRGRMDHSEILHFIDSLRDLDQTPSFLFIGQHLTVRVDQQYVLAEFSEDEAKQLLSHSDLNLSDLTDDQKIGLARATGGNPTMLALAVSLIQSGESISALFGQHRDRLSVETLIERLWAHFDAQEQELLAQLSVFREAAPEDAWSTQQELMGRLVARNVLQRDGYGGVSAPDSIAGFVQRRITADRKQDAHVHAAQIMETRGVYTQAAYHYIHGGQPAIAAYLWLAHYTEEQESGRTSQAYDMFKDVTFGELSDESDRQALAMVLSLQAEHLGKATNAEQALRHAIPAPDHTLTPYWHDYLGKSLERQGRLHEALEEYRQGLAAFDNPAFREIHLHHRLGELYINRLVDVDKAWLQAQTARYNTEMFSGDVQEKRGDFSKALQHFQTALALTDELEDPQAAKARIYSCLGRVSWMMLDIDQAIHYLNTALRIFREQGATFRILNDQINLVGAYIMGAQYEKAREEAVEGLAVARALGQPDLVAGLATNGSEACAKLGLLDQAEGLANEALSQEESIWEPYAVTVIGIVQHKRGEYDRASRTFRDAIRMAQEAHEPYAEAPAWRYLGEVCRDQHKVEQARDAFAKSAEMFDGMGLTRLSDEVRSAMAALP